MRLLDECRGCGAPLEREVFAMEPMPLAGAFADSAKQALAAERLPLTWLQCDRCELVQVAEDVGDEVLYSKYCYASSAVESLVDHFKKYARFLRLRFGHRWQQVLEIGCNDGVLLRQLPCSWDCVGVDPSDVAAVALQNGDVRYELINEPFGTALGLRQEFNLVLASNCLAHMTAIDNVVEAAAQALVPGGEFWVEVHDLDATLRTGQWDTVYHEHKAEYSARSLSRVVVRHGFSVLEVKRLPLHGGLLRMGFLRGVIGKPLTSRVETFDLLRQSYSQRRETTLYGELSGVKMPIAYGAAGRATVWFNQLPELEFAVVIDDSPLRAGRFVPGVGWPIVPWPARPPSDICVVTAWNYAKAIIQAHPEYEGCWLQTWEVSK